MNNQSSNSAEGGYLNKSTLVTSFVQYQRIFGGCLAEKDYGKDTDNIPIYNSNFEHILEELYRIDQMVRLCLDRYRADPEGMDDLRGLFISEDEVNTILRTAPYGLEADPCSGTEYEEIKTRTREIDRKKVESIKKGKELRLPLLEELFHLTPFEMDVLLICLASELDLRYEKLYSYLQDDVSKKRPTVDLVIKLLCHSIEERFDARKRFSPTAPLIRNRLVYIVSDGSDWQLPLLSKFIKVDERIIGFILGDDEIDPRIRNFSSVIEPERSFPDITSSEDDKNTLMDLISWHSSSKVPLMLFFHGPYGTGKKMTAVAVCMELGTPLLMVKMKTLMENKSSETLDITLREAMLQNSPLYLDGFDALLKEGAGVTGTDLIEVLDRFPNWVFLSGELPWEPAAVLKNHKFINHVFPLPSFTLRKRLWESFLSGYGSVSDDVDINAIASKFNFSGGQIKDAIFTACNTAMAKKPGESELSMTDLYHGCRAQSNKKLAVLAKKTDPHYTWEDIVLPKDTKDQLEEVCGFIKCRGTVYDDWGFDKKLSIGKGLNILFSGPSGTGKTMAAEIIAREALLDIYKIDLSQVVSKYIGETEKNLKKIFQEAETSNAIMFFDEADALFGKRSEVKDSHDRYANIEISYLLQKMEEYEGVSILATNLYQNMDEAFVRRLQVIIEFPFPNEEYRRRIWEVIFPQEAPLGDDIDFGSLAREVRLAGGNIKNIALAAAFYAADDGGVIQVQHLVRAAQREYQKLGRSWDGVFGWHGEEVVSG